MKGIEGGGSISIARGVSAPSIGMGITRAISPGAQILSRGWSPIRISGAEHAGLIFRSQPETHRQLNLTNIELRPPKYVPARRIKENLTLWEEVTVVSIALSQPLVEKVRSRKKLPRFRSRIDPGNIISLASSIVAAVDISPKQSLNIDVDEEEKTRNQAKRIAQVDTQAALEAVRVRIQALSSPNPKRADTPFEARHVATVLKTIQKEVTEQVVADKQDKKEKETGSWEKRIRWKFVKDIKAMAERLRLITENTRKYEHQVSANPESRISAKAIAKLMPSESANEGVVSAILRNKRQPDGSYRETITAMENAGEFASGNEALDVFRKIVQANRAVKIASENDSEEQVGYADVQKVLQRRIVKIDAHQVVQVRIQRKKMEQEQVWIEEKVVKSSSVFDTQEIPEEAIDLSKETILLARQALKIAA